MQNRKEREMRKKLDLEELRKFYRNNSIIKTERGFEMPDERSKLTMVLSDNLYLAADGNPIKQTAMLTVPRTHSLETFLGFEFAVMPLELQYLCGKAEVYDETWYFWPADLKSVPTSPDMQVVLLKVHWDRNQNVDGRGWNEELRRRFSGTIYYAYCDCDDYQEVGDWYWLINVGWPPTVQLSGTGLFGALFASTMQLVLKRAGTAMREFRQYRGWYAGEIRKILSLLNDKNGDWMVIYDDDESVVLEYVHGRDKEPIRHPYRHDKIGLEKCEKKFAWLLQEKV